jgi:hypothetical protein
MQRGLYLNIAGIAGLLKKKVIYKRRLLSFINVLTALLKKVGARVLLLILTFIVLFLVNVKIPSLTF